MCVSSLGSVAGKGLKALSGSGGTKVIIFKRASFLGGVFWFLKNFWRAGCGGAVFGVFFMSFLYIFFGFFLRELLNLCLSKF